MSDLISRQEVSDIIKTRLYQTALNNTECITSFAKVCEDIAENRIDTWINEAKSVEPERKKGKWMDPEQMICWCSICGCRAEEVSNYCPDCGAQMRPNWKKMEVDG